MKTKFYTLLRAEILSQMATSLPKFQLLRSANEPKYRFRGDRRVNYFLHFQFTQKNAKAFTVNCAWSPDNLWPNVDGGSIPLDIPERHIIRNMPKNADYSFRIGHLFSPHRDFWWEIVPGKSLEELMKSMENLDFLKEPDDNIDEFKITESVSDSIEKIRRYAIPYFEKYSAEWKP